MKEGIVAGGGSALLYAGRVLDKLKVVNEDQAVGVKLVKNVLKAPIKQIAENAGFEGAVICNEVITKADPAYGYDAQNNKFVDMFKAGIVDPTKVVRTALQDAASIAGLLITTECAIVEKKEEDAGGAGAHGHMGGGMPGMGF